MRSLLNLRRLPLRVLTVANYFRFYLKNRFAKTRFSKDSGQPTVSMTSHGKRLKVVFVAIESILDGGKPSPPQMVLWLPKDSKIPKSLSRLQTRGLQIMLVEDLRSHTKWYYCTLDNGLLETGVILADDDLIYPKNWYRRIVESVNADIGVPMSVRVRWVSPKTPSRGHLDYSAWGRVGSEFPDMRNFPTSGHGLYLPGAFLKVIDNKIDRFLKLSKTSDDIWLWAEMIRNGFSPKQLEAKSVDYPSVLNFETPLGSHNNKRGGNNEILAKMASTRPWSNFLNPARFGTLENRVS